MRAARSLSTRLAALGGALAIAASGMVGAVGLVATAGPAGAASTPTGTTLCHLSAPAGDTPINASVSASIAPSPVPAGNSYTVSGLALTSTLVANATTTLGAGSVLAVTFSSTLSATGATPASQAVSFSGSVSLPNPVPIGATAPIELTSPPVTFSAAASGAMSTAVSVDPSGHLSVSLGSLAFAGDCNGPPPVEIASAAITPAAGYVTNVFPNAGLNTGAQPVKIVGNHFSGASEVDFVESSISVPGTTVSVPATDVKVVNDHVITCTSPAVSPDAAALPDTTNIVSDVIVTTAAGPSQGQPLDNFTYVDPTLGAIVSNVSPSAGAATGGTQVNINGYGFDDSANFGGPINGVSFGSVALQPSDYTIVSNNLITATVPAGSGIVDVTVLGFDGLTVSPTGPGDRYNYNPGYILSGSDGGVFSYGQIPGNAGFFGSAGNLTLNKPVVGMAVTPDGGGYWQVASDGGVFAYGDATFRGSAGDLTLNKPIVGMASTADGAGYWLVASDGGIFAYGDAIFNGSAGNITLNKPIVGMAATSDDGGYWLVASDGGVFAYGDAVFAGSTGNITLNKPIVGMAANPMGTGYWLVASDGGVFAYGAAPFLGSLGGTSLSSPIAGISATISGNGYWLFAQGGAVFHEGDAGFYGDLAGTKLNGPIVGFAPVQTGQDVPTSDPVVVTPCLATGSHAVTGHC